MRLGTFRAILHRKVQHIYGLQTERIAVLRREREGILEILPGSCLVAGLVSEPAKPHLDRRVRLDRVGIFKKFDRFRLKTVMHIFERQLNIRLNLVTHQNLQAIGSAKHIPFGDSVGVERILGENPVHTGKRVIFPTKFTEYACLEVKSLEVAPVVSHGLVETLKRHIKIFG